MTAWKRETVTKRTIEQRYRKQFADNSLRTTKVSLRVPATAGLYRSLAVDCRVHFRAYFLDRRRGALKGARSLYLWCIQHVMFCCRLTVVVEY